jgi:hypothetical protein
MIKFNKFHTGTGGASEERVQTLADLILGRNKERARVDDARTEKILTDVLGRPIGAKAQAIIRAAQLRRGELPPDTQKLSPTARAIINAGRRRRNEEPI